MDFRDLIDASGKIISVPKDVADRIMRRMGLLDQHSWLERDIEVSEKLLNDFRRIHAQNQRLIEHVKGLSADHNAFVAAIAEGSRKTPLRELEETDYWKISEKIVSWMNRIGVREDTTNQDYITNFRTIKEKEKAFNDAILGLENEIEKAVKTNDANKSADLMEDYLAVVNAKRAYMGLVREQGIGKIVREELTKIDGELRAELGDDFEKMVEGFRQRKVNFELWIPVLGGVAVYLAGSRVLNFIVPVADNSIKTVEKAVKAAKAAGRAGRQVTRREFFKSLFGRRRK